MEGQYIYSMILDGIYLIICYFIKRNKNYNSNFELLWLFGNIAYLAGNRNVSSTQISYFSGSLLILAAVYMTALDFYKNQVKNKKIDK